MSLAFPNTVLNTIVAEAIDELADALEGAPGADIAEKVTAVVKDAYLANKQVLLRRRQLLRRVARRGRAARAQEPAHHPRRAARGARGAHGRPPSSKYEVLSERELESRYEVWVEQYVIRANIEAETTAAIARTMLLPAVLRHLALIDAAEVPGLADEVRPLAEELVGGDPGAREPRTATPTGSRAWSSRSTPATTSSPRWRRCARWRTGSRSSWPTTSGRCRSTARSCSCASRRPPAHRPRPCGGAAGRGAPCGGAPVGVSGACRGRAGRGSRRSADRSCGRSRRSRRRGSRRRARRTRRRAIPCAWAPAPTSAGRSVPVTVPPSAGQAGGEVPAGALPRLVHRNVTIPPLLVAFSKWMWAWVAGDSRSS